jgi:peptidoglycan hydrolase CwlO-like protein
MKTVLMASFTVAFCAAALADTTIYKLVDDSGRVTYSNKPMKGATVVELEPLTTLPTPPAVTAAKSNFKIYSAAEKTARADEKPGVAALTPIHTSLASIDVQTQKRRDDGRRRILEDELQKEEQSLDEARSSLTKEQQNPELAAAVRVAQNAVDPTPAQLQEFRQNIDKASGRIRGLQATVAEHEKNIEALKKELGALKP